jgi:hypothetical protein
MKTTGLHLGLQPATSLWGSETTVNETHPPQLISSYSQRCKQEELYLLWDIMPCSPVKVNRRFGGFYCFYLHDRRVNQIRDQHGAGSKQRLAYSSVFKMKPVCSTETSVDIHRNTRRYISEDRIIHSHFCENLKPGINWSSARLHGVISQRIIFFPPLEPQI